MRRAGLVASLGLVAAIGLGGCWDGPGSGGEGSVRHQPPPPSAESAERTPALAPPEQLRARPLDELDRAGIAEEIGWEGQGWVDLDDVGLSPNGQPAAFLEPDGSLRVNCQAERVWCDDEGA